MARTQTCTRCHGSGSHSYNAKDGTRCYGCGGSGLIPLTEKGKKIKPTCGYPGNAVVGDIIEIDTLYRVERIVWIAYKVIGPDRMFPQERNQQLILTRLTDDKKCRIFRCKREEGVAIIPTEEMIGKEVA